MAHPDRGCCMPALEDRASLLCDPTVDEADTAIERAIARASEDAATLFIAFIGHGEYAEDDFYLLPFDAGWPPDSKRAVLVAKRVQELLRRYDRLDGLVLLVDACHSGLGALQAAAHWPGAIGAAGGRFEVLTSADERAAADGCFTATLIELLRSGESNLGESLRCADLQPLLQSRCGGSQDTVHVAFVHGRRLVEGDEGLWLARNARRTMAPLVGTPAWGQVERLTAWFQLTPQLDELVDASRSARCLALVGLAGAGKSTLVSALARSELADDLIPARFVHGLVFAASAVSAADLAYDLHRQLTLTVPGFAAAAKAFQQQTPEQTWRQLDVFHQQVIGPLWKLKPERLIRIVVDGIDQLSVEASPGVLAALQTLAGDPELHRVRVVVTARPDTALPAGHRRQDVDHVEEVYIQRYLERRQVPLRMRSVVSKRAAGNWLVARLLADLAADVDVTELPATLDQAYRSELVRIGADQRDEWEHALAPVLSVLAVTGVGPVLPLPLLCRASGLLGGPEQPARVRDVLVRLRGLVVRGNAGTPNEHAGLFHDTLAAYLLRGQDFDVDLCNAHQALADAIADLAPAAEHNLADPLHRYAATAEAEHLWALDRHGQALASVQARQSHVPAENLARWRSWYERTDGTLGPDHLHTLTARANIARWTGEAGNAREALRLFQALLPDWERLLGPDHPQTLTARADNARWTGEAGNAREALQLYQALLPDWRRLLGPDHAQTLAARVDIAHWTGWVGDVPEALRLFQALLPDWERLLNPDHPGTMAIRAHVAYWTGKAGNAREALQLYQALLPDQARLLGPDHPDTLATRVDIAHWTGWAGDVPE
ncbi:MAG: tetratricopeptide repeat protein, partial [Egibacteraceae bacterium]